MSANSVIKQVEEKAERLHKFQIKAYAYLILQYFNFHLVGAQGSGKSSLLNSFVTALSNETKVSSPQVVLNQPKSVTTEYCRVPLTNSIFISDAWGWTPTNYDPTSHEFEYILQGRLKELTAEGSGARINDHLLDQKTVTQQNRVHCCFFVLPADSATNAEYLKRLATFREWARKEDVECIILVTKVDLVAPELRQNPEKINSHPAVRKIIAELATKQEIGVNENQILPCMSYGPEATRVLELDSLLLDVLEKAVFSAENWMSRQNNKLRQSGSPPLENGVQKKKASYAIEVM